MDPNQAWIDLSAVITADEWGRAVDIADDLLEWLAKGGFAPKITGGDRQAKRAHLGRLIGIETGPTASPFLCWRLTRRHLHRGGKDAYGGRLRTNSAGA
jgi:hypothetical protein